MCSAAPDIYLGGGHFSGFYVRPTPPDPCANVAVGDPCTNGVLYGGSGFTGLGSYKYMTTPEDCAPFVNNFTGFTPNCTSALENLIKWAANNNFPSASNVSTGVTSTTAGASNTTTLATMYMDTDAARYCENMTYPPGGYTDWYLPSKDELHLVLYPMKLAGKGNFTTFWYWSSTESDPTGAYGEHFNIGDQAGGSKTASWYVRCVRRY